MGLLDKMKATAKEAAGEGREKLEEVALKRKLDAAAQELGYLVFRERTQSVPAGAQLEEVIARMSSLQEQLQQRTKVQGDTGAAARGAGTALPTDTPPASVQDNPATPEETPPRED